MSSKRVKRFWINEDECLAHYLCVSEAPHILEYIEGKNTVQIKAEFLNPRNTDLAQGILLAADVCPMRDAIMIEFEDGTFYNSYS